MISDATEKAIEAYFFAAAAHGVGPGPVESRRIVAETHAALVQAIEAEVARIAGLERRNEQHVVAYDELAAALADARTIAAAAQAPAHWWDADDWECTYQETCELTCNLGFGEIMRVGRAAALPDQWAVRVLIDPDEDAEEEVRFYDTIEEARAALAAVLARAMEDKPT